MKRKVGLDEVNKRAFDFGRQHGVAGWKNNNKNNNKTETNPVSKRRRQTLRRKVRMKSTSNCSYAWAGALALAIAMAASVGSAAPPQTPLPNPQAYQRDLPFWLETYWTWYYTGADPAQSVVDGYQLMPLPNGELISGSWTPEDPALLRGQIEITVAPGTPFHVSVTCLFPGVAIKVLGGFGTCVAMRTAPK